MAIVSTNKPTLRMFDRVVSRIRTQVKRSKAPWSLSMQAGVVETFESDTWKTYTPSGECTVTIRYFVRASKAAALARTKKKNANG